MSDPGVRIETLDKEGNQYSVTVHGKFIGYVQRDWVNYQSRPGQMDSKRVWFIIPPSHVTDAHPEQTCNWAEVRGEAVMALAAPHLGLPTWEEIRS